MPVFRVPKLSHHKASGNAVVRLGGKDFYLGPWQSKAEPSAELYTRIRQAMTDKRALQCTYESPLRKTIVESDRFRFDAYALYFGQRAWYAIGFHHGHSEVRT
jgi:predicted DNA-binding transcriptional regulator YafY